MLALGLLEDALFLGAVIATAAHHGLDPGSISLSIAELES